MSESEVDSTRLLQADTRPIYNNDSVPVFIGLGYKYQALKPFKFGEEGDKAPSNRSQTAHHRRRQLQVGVLMH